MKSCFYFLICSFLIFSSFSFSQNVVFDNTFSGNGIFTKDFLTGSDIAYSLAIAPDGKIIAAGTVQDNQGAFDFAVVRLNDDGSLDNSFSSDGYTTTDIAGSGATDYGLSVIIQPDKKILVGGWTFKPGGDDFAMARYKEDGLLDEDFGNGGIVITNIGTTDVANCIKLQQDRKIVLSGYSYGGDTYDFAVARYDTLGHLDPDFGNGGKVTTDIAGDRDYGLGMAIDKNDKIIVAGEAKTTVGNQLALVRYNTDGTLDTGFDGDGKTTTLINGYSLNGSSASVVLQNDGKIVIACTYYDGSFSKIGVVRLNDDGSLDDSWGTNGIVQTSIGNYDDEVYGIAIQTDGKILITGYSFFENSMNDFFIARYNTDGSLDEGFDTDGIFITPIGPDYSYDIAYGIAVSDDGIYVCGYSEMDYDNEKDFTVVRFEVNTSSGIKNHNAEGAKCLYQNYPNPFSSETKIKYTVPENAGNIRVQLKLYDILGKEVTTLVDKKQPPGTYSVSFHPLEDMHNGIFYYSLDEGEIHYVRKMVLMK